MDFEHEKRLTEVEERSKSNMHRLDDVEKRQDDLEELVSTVKVLAVREENVETDVKEIKNDVQTIRELALSQKNGDESACNEIIRLSDKMIQIY